MNQPPAPPPDRIGLGWTVIDQAGKARSLVSYDDWANVKPWLFTWMEIQYKMIPDGDGWRAVLDWENTRVYVVDVKTHVRRELKTIE